MYQVMASPLVSPASLTHRTFTRHPYKATYTAITITLLPVRLLLILLYNIPPSLRPHIKWTYHQAIGRAILCLWFNYASTVEFRPPKSLSQGADGDRFVTMPPAPDSNYRSILTRDPAVRPTVLGAMWYPRPYDPRTNQGTKIAIHLHGGTYVLGGVRPMEAGWGPPALAGMLDGFCLMPQYRLATDEGSRFPAALQDALTAYVYLLDRGVAARDIVLSGDSAGAHLVLALVRYLSEEKVAGLPLPRAALLWSPWLDLRMGPEAVERHPNKGTDYVPGPLVEWGIRKLVPPGMKLGDPYFSPLGNEFMTSVPLFIQTGGAEILHEHHVRFVDAMREIKGNTVELDVVDNAPHDTFGLGHILGFVRQTEGSIAKASKCVERF